METDLHLHILEYQASLKYENFTISQLHHITTAKHFAATATFFVHFTASTIWGL